MTRQFLAGKNRIEKSTKKGKSCRLVSYNVSRRYTWSHQACLRKMFYCNSVKFVRITANLRKFSLINDRNLSRTLIEPWLSIYIYDQGKLNMTFMDACCQKIQPVTCGSANSSVGRNQQ